MSSLLVVIAIMLQGQLARASFLSVVDMQGIENATQRQQLISRVSVALGVASNGVSLGSVVPAIEGLLSPIFDTSPKNEHGRLDADAARYALQRLFMERHGWVIKHYDTPVEMSMPSSSVFTFREDFPMTVRSLLENEVKEKGSSIVELSVFAAVLEQLIYDESPRKLEGTYVAKGLSINTRVTKAQAEGLIDLYMTCYISAIDINAINPAQAFDLLSRMATEYHDWAGTRDFFHTTLESQIPDQETFSFENVMQAVWSIEKNFVYWNNHQCSSYKDELMTMELRDSGHVRLRDFYEHALRDNTSTFLESVDYLLQIGAMEDTDPVEPRIVISNYLDGPNNCVARTGYYSVCCMDECADLYSHLENALRKPAATPAEIIPIAEGLASASMSQCRRLSTPLTVELQAIADRNDGLVLVHGRDFSEWMHLVYPRECANTAAFGPARSMTIEEWQEETHLNAQATVEDMMAATEHLKYLEQTRAEEETQEPLGDNSAASMMELDDYEFADMASPISFETFAKMALLALALMLLLPKVSGKLPTSCSQRSSSLEMADVRLTDWDV
jgi:hypothetical protein